NTPQNPHWPLNGLIEGWVIGIPLIKEGGSIRLLVPSALAYGCEGRSVIPGNTPLFFEVTLVDVQ
ncbi:FKBP-type peptidyl-prolyl cis-trans isomerase, partial [Salmonella enterica]|uniref:FKBP-type peptidyl-prolyl cis-trans isomerase n=1 Tax=Salmonella enterica TaxID=28901 RepID=UPI003CFAEEE0